MAHEGRHDEGHHGHVQAADAEQVRNARCGPRVALGGCEGCGVAQGQGLGEGRVRWCQARFEGLGASGAGVVDVPKPRSPRRDEGVVRLHLGHVGPSPPPQALVGWQLEGMVRRRRRRKLQSHHEAVAACNGAAAMQGQTHMPLARLPGIAAALGQQLRGRLQAQVPMLDTPIGRRIDLHLP